MNRNEFETSLRTLLEEHVNRTDNERCIECHGSTGCSDSTFCRGSKNLVRCHYCVDSERLVESTHCRKSRELTACHHCVACERCRDSSYLVRSFDMVGCSYCFGCVGLVKKDFHVLNVRYERREYFELTNRLARELGLT